MQTFEIIQENILGIKPDQGVINHFQIIYMLAYASHH